MSPSTGSGQALDLDDLGPEVLAFLTERHLATLTTLRADGSPHVVPVGFSYDPQTRLARVITSGDSVKARNADRASTGSAGISNVAALCQVDRARWLTLSGPIRVEREPAAVADAERRYAERYRQPRENPKRVVLIIEVSRMLGRP
ncbi:MAG TPA: TIGR03618 family F420-dependent PPOX class oxidoreductase [Propionibacteriaceae bacterium]|nr:TIGR03618 family F420-dependent PPOX class oxidoreductase [Propionibacteriaceae bacterium]